MQTGRSICPRGGEGLIDYREAGSFSTPPTVDGFLRREGDPMFAALFLIVGDRGEAEALAREQAVEDEAPADAVVVLEQQPHLLEQALLARYLEIEQDIPGRQKFRDETHDPAPAPQRSRGRGL